MRLCANTCRQQARLPFVPVKEDRLAACVILYLLTFEHRCLPGRLSVLFDRATRHISVLVNCNGFKTLLDVMCAKGCKKSGMWTSNIVTGLLCQKIGTASQMTSSARCIRICELSPHLVRKLVPLWELHYFGLTGNTRQCLVVSPWLLGECGVVSALRWGNASLAQRAPAPFIYCIGCQSFFTIRVLVKGDSHSCVAGASLVAFGIPTQRQGGHDRNAIREHRYSET